MEPRRPDEALAEAVMRCATTGTRWVVLNSNREAVWVIEPDTKVDDDDLTFPVIVHMRGGTLTDESIALLAEVQS
jgi:hypothetical protein